MGGGGGSFSANVNGTSTSGDSSIYLNAGFKSYEITKCHSGAESWYEWSERSRYLMRRVKTSHEVLKWLVSVFIEATKLQGKAVRRWRRDFLYS